MTICNESDAFLDSCSSVMLPCELNKAQRLQMTYRGSNKMLFEQFSWIQRYINAFLCSACFHHWPFTLMIVRIILLAL